ncbi:hypothetical protein UNDKW_3942 [Undibacterium sp. KW1]|nr:hypothetical protein UNDKW_3942 [Undibacterium sp. KW1]
MASSMDSIVEIYVNMDAKTAAISGQCDKFLLPFCPEADIPQFALLFRLYFNAN